MHSKGATFQKWGLAVFLTLVLLAAVTNKAFAQSATGTLTGTVTDPKGLAMANATIVVHSEDTGVDMKPVMSNETGIYVAPLLPPGIYDVTASQSGFASVQHKGITLEVGQTVRLDFAMPVQSQQSLVTVTTEIPVLETEKTEQTQNVSENMVANLPVSSRRWEQFVFLTPGVTPDGTSNGISFHGLNSLYNNNSVDGANNNSSYNGASRGGGSDGYVYSGDSIREFQVSSSNFNAELGQAAGGSVNAVTKSGTANYHGDLFYNGRSPNFNAFDPVSKANAAVNGTAPSIPVHQQDQYGGSFGGPILKDKLFFFVTVDDYDKVDPLFTTTQQMTPSIGQLVCPTLGAGDTIPNPAGGAPLTGGAAQARIATVCANAKNFATNNIVGTFPRSLAQEVQLLKFDYQLNQSNHISIVGNLRDWRQPTSLQSVSGGTSYLQDRFAIATVTTVIGTDKVNELRYQYGVDNSFSTLNSLYGAPQMALSNLFTYGQGGGTGFSNEIRNEVSDNFSITKGTHTIKFGTDMNFITDYQRSSTNSAGAYSYSGAVAFASGTSCTNSAFPSAQAANNIFCDWLVDVSGATDGAKTGQHWTTYTQITDLAHASYPATFNYTFPDTDFAGYVQDVWKARPNLTINYGLRYDVQLLPAPDEDSTIVYGANDLPILAHFTDTINNQFNAIQPRVGVAWNFRKNTVLRFGGGLFYAKTPGSTIKTIISGAGESNVNCKTPVVTTIGPTQTCPGALEAPDLLFNQQDTTAPTWNGYAPPFPGAISTAVTPPTALSFPNATTGIRGIDPNAVRPRAIEAEAAVEQQLPGNLNLSVSYVFTRGLFIPTSNDSNEAVNFDTNLCSNPATTAGSTVGQNCGVYITKTYDVVNTSGTTTTESTVPFFYSRVDPRTGPIVTQFTDVNSTYNGLVVTLRKPASHGLELLANYTLSKATDDGQGGNNISGGGISSEGFVATDGVISPFNQSLEQGYSSTDARNRFTASVLYAPPFTKNIQNKVLKAVGDGWSISSAITATNGTRFSGTVSSSASETTNYCSTGVVGCQNPGYYLPGSAAATTEPFTAQDGGMSGADIQTTGNVFGGRIAWMPRNSFSLPNLYNVDLRLTKETTIKERYAIELRFEAFNLFNSTLVLAESTNAYNYSAPSSAAGATCPASLHVNTCMVPVSTFLQPSTTTGLLLGPRQLQAGVRFSF